MNESTPPPQKGQGKLAAVLAKYLVLGLMVLILMAVWLVLVRWVRKKVRTH